MEACKGRTEPFSLREALAVTASIPRRHADHLRIRHLGACPRWSSCSPPRIVPAILGTLLALASAAAAAAQASGASDAFGLSTKVNAGPASVLVQPTPAASGQAPPAYDRHGEVAAAGASAPGHGPLAATGIVQESAASPP